MQKLNTNILKYGILFVVLACFILPGFLLPAISATRSTMGDASQHMEFVWMVPVLTAIMVYIRRKAIFQSIGKPAPLLALPFFILAGALLFLGMRGGQDRFLQVSGICALLGLPLACCGKKTFKLTALPILILLFVMPLGFLDNVTVPLRHISVTITVGLLKGFGIAVRQLGTAIIATKEPFFQLDVADPCSGIRSILALLAGTLAYGALTLDRPWKRIALVLSSLPIALVGNVIRLFLTALVSHLAGQKAGMTLHDNALFIIAPIYIGCVFGLADLLKKVHKSKLQSEPSNDIYTLLISPWLVVKYILILGVLAMGLLFAHQSSPLTFESDDYLNKSFATLPGMTARTSLNCQNVECLWANFFSKDEVKPDVCPKCGGELAPVSKAELDILPADTQCFKVQYTVNEGVASLHAGDTFTVSLVIAGKSRFSIHRPELCLPSQGYTLSVRQTAEPIPGLPVAIFSLRREGQAFTSGFAYTFLWSGGATISNLRRVLGDGWERSMYNRIPRWSMVTIASNRDFLQPENATVLADFLKIWAPSLRACEAK